MSCRINKGGFTLIEMIVVIAIIATLTAIAVPTMGKLGMFGRDPLSVGARQTLVMLKAARIYAGTHNVDTAVAYSIGPHKDSMNAVEVPVMDSLAMVRRLTVREMDLLKQHVQNLVTAGVIDQTEADARVAFATQGSERANPASLPFVPVKDKDGVFTPLARGAALAAWNSTTQSIEVRYESEPTATWGPMDWGLSPIRVVDEDLMPIEPRVKQGSSPKAYHEYNPYGYDNLSARFPAHVFKPSGVLQTPGSERARFVISVRPAPDAPQDARFLESGLPVPTEDIEIFSTIGRIQAAS